MSAPKLIHEHMVLAVVVALLPWALVLTGEAPDLDKGEEGIVEVFA